MKPVILLVDDDPVDLVPLRMLVQGWDFDVHTARSVAEAFTVLAATPVDLVISDIVMPGATGVELVRRARDEHPDLPVVLVSGQDDVKTAVQAMRLGAFDYLVKPPDPDELRITVERALEHSSLRRENRFLRAEMSVDGAHGERLIGRSPAMLVVFDLIQRVARTDSTVLITGETGTGKERVAQTIHCRSRRAAAPFVAFNCAAVPATLAESELFGHEKGAFTGATATRRGRFEEASGGTIFLDEIAETTPEFQSKLLRVLQEREIERVGGPRIKVDCRVLASTNRDLARAIERGTFRKDLFYRLNVIPIRVPPLRERREDIVPLAEHFIGRYAAQYGLPSPRLGPAARAHLEAQPWPGNVRELEHAAERAVVLARGDELQPDDLRLPDAESPADGGSAGGNRTLEAHLDHASRAHVLRILDESKWNKQQAARVLGVDRTTLYRLIARYGIEREGD